MDPFRELYQEFARAARGLGIPSAEEMRPKLAQLYKNILEANRRMNLTRISTPEGFLFKHALDALVLLPVLEQWQGARAEALCDVGSGAGVPGLVLAIARPWARVTLVERTLKKAQFLKRTAEALEIRAEVAALDAAQYRPAERFDLVTARAVGPAERALGAAGHLVAAGGVLALYQGPSVEERLDAVRRAARKAGLEPPRTVRIEVPRAGARVLVLLRKPEDGNYPRTDDG